MYITLLLEMHQFYQHNFWKNKILKAKSNIMLGKIFEKIVAEGLGAKIKIL